MTAKLRLLASIVIGTLLSTSSLNAEKPAMQTPQALSVGTSTNLGLAADAMRVAFREISPRDTPIPFNRLPVLAGGKNPGLADAARFFMASALARHLGSDGDSSGLTLDGLSKLKRTAIDPQFAQRLLTRYRELGSESGHFLHATLTDPGLPDQVRQEFLRSISDDALLNIFGPPLVLGGARDQQDVRKAYIYLIRLSWLGAAEAAAIAEYRVPFKMIRGAADHAESFWDGHQVNVSERMLGGSGPSLNAAALGQHIGTFAHESGHAIFGRSGLNKRFGDDMNAAGVTSGMTGVVNEAFAGVFQNRAHVAAGHFDPAKIHQSNLSIVDDINKNIARSDAFYAKYYHVNVAKAKSQMPKIEAIIASDLIPYLQSAMHLVDDPQLALGL